jgi:hypothetical protein
MVPKQQLPSADLANHADPAAAPEPIGAIRGIRVRHLMVTKHQLPSAELANCADPAAAPERIGAIRGTRVGQLMVPRTATAERRSR